MDAVAMALKVAQLDALRLAEVVGVGFVDAVGDSDPVELTVPELHAVTSAVAEAGADCDGETVAIVADAGAVAAEELDAVRLGDGDDDGDAESVASEGDAANDADAERDFIDDT